MKKPRWNQVEEAEMKPGNQVHLDEEAEMEPGNQVHLDEEAEMEPGRRSWDETR